MSNTLYFRHASQVEENTTSKVVVNMFNNPKVQLFIVLVLAACGLFVYFKYFHKSDFEIRQAQLRKIYENPQMVVLDFRETYEKITFSWQDDMRMPSWEELFELSTPQLLRLFDRIEATGNRLLVDMIREVLLARWTERPSFDFKKLLPPGVYTVVVVRTDFGWGISILESEQLFEQIVSSDFYAGATNVYIRGDGIFEIQDITYINSSMVGITREIIEGIVEEMLRDLGYRNVEHSKPKWIPGVLPELPNFSKN